MPDAIEQQLAKLENERDELKQSLATTMEKLDQSLKTNGELVREKRELEGKPKPPIGKTLDGVIVTETELIVPRAMASEPAQYRHWKSTAQEQGKELKIQTPKRVIKPDTVDDLPDRITSDDRGIHYVKRSSVAGNAKAYQDEKRFAELKGYRFFLFDNPNQLPNEVFENDK